MAVLEIITLGDDVLRQETDPVPKLTKKITKLINDMIETMYAADGVGLAAPQVSVSLRLIVVDVGEGPLVLMNPKLVKAFGQELDVEGCLSIPGKQGYVGRSTHIVVEGLSERGKPVRIEAEGLLARALQHEMDHLNGVLFIDRVEDVEDIIEKGV